MIAYPTTALGASKISQSFAMGCQWCHIWLCVVCNYPAVSAVALWTHSLFPFKSDEYAHRRRREP